MQCLITVSCDNNYLIVCAYPSELGHIKTSDVAYTGSQGVLTIEDELPIVYFLRYM